jgi:hypothetical protein
MRAPVVRRRSSPSTRHEALRFDEIGRFAASRSDPAAVTREDVAEPPSAAERYAALVDELTRSSARCGSSSPLHRRRV